MATLNTKYPQFVREYILTMMFTASDDDGDSLYDGTPGGQFEYDHTPDEAIDDLPESELSQIVADCESFWESALEISPDCEQHEEAIASDFHYTRNGHGTGFWDRDYLAEELMEKLCELARPHGTLELTCYTYDNGESVLTIHE